MNQLPTRLGRDPIVQAICEIRFEPESADNSSLLLGLLFSALREDFPKHSKLPNASLPAELRGTVPQLSFAHLYRLSGNGKAVNIGEKSLSVAVTDSYIGWASFQPLILKVFRAAVETGLLGVINRMSIRYTNRIEIVDGSSLEDALKAKVALGGDEVSRRGAGGADRSALTVRHESRLDGLITIVQIGFPATFTLNGKLSKGGLAVDIDVVADGLDSGSDFSAEMQALLERIHAQEKKTFFALLSDEALAAYDPQY